MLGRCDPPDQKTYGKNINLTCTIDRRPGTGFPVSDVNQNLLFIESDWRAEKL